MSELKAKIAAVLAIVAASGVLVLATAGVTYAADSTDAEELIREGIALRRAGSDSRALPLFQKAHALAHTPRTAAQLGLVEFALGYALESEQHLGQALASPSDPWVGKNRDVLDDALTRVRTTIGEIAVSGAPAGAEVFLNGKSAGHLPLAAPIRAGQGPVNVELRSPGYATASSSVDVVGGKRHDVSIHLVPALDLSVHQTTSERPPISDGASTAESGSSTRRMRTIVGWSLIGAGVAVAVSGVVWLANVQGPCNAMPGFVCSRAEPSHAPGWLLIGGGAAAAIGGGIVLLTRPSGTQVEVGFGPSLLFLKGRL